VPAVLMSGVGLRVSHNLIHDHPHCAILFGGNEHLIEYNEIHHALLEGDDMGAFYMGRDPTERGNVVRFNYWHDLAVTNRTHGMYFDDTGGDGTTIYGNVFLRAGKMDAIFVNGGSDFTIANNIFIDCPTALRQNGKDGNMRWLTQDGRFEGLLKAVRYNQSPWRERYPELQDYLEARKTMPRRNVFKNNLLVNGRTLPGSYRAENNWSTTGDPGFVDMKNGDFNLKPDAEVFRKIAGFEPIPMDRIGLTRSPGESDRVRMNQ
jgi:hypothetical protein